MSPKWLLSQRRGKEARQVLEYVAKGNGKEMPRGVLAMPHSNEKRTSITDLFRDSKLRWPALVMMLDWMVVSFLFYGLSVVLSALSNNIYLNFFLLSFAELPANLMAWLMMDWRRLGRVGSLYLTFGIGGIICLVLIFTANITEAATVLGFGGKLMATAAFAVVYIYPVEFFPTSVASAVVGLSSTSSRLGGVLAPQVILLTSYGKGYPFIVFGAFSLLAAAASWTLQETLPAAAKAGAKKADKDGLAQNLIVNNDDDHRLEGGIAAGDNGRDEQPLLVGSSTEA